MAFSRRIRAQRVLIQIHGHETYEICWKCWKCWKSWNRYFSWIVKNCGKNRPIEHLRPSSLHLSRCGHIASRKSSRAIFWYRDPTWSGCKSWENIVHGRLSASMRQYFRPLFLGLHLHCCQPLLLRGTKTNQNPCCAKWGETTIWNFYALEADLGLPNICGS